MAKEVIGFDILAMQEACNKMPPYKRADCPNCGWNLETSPDDIIHCKFCGYASEHPLKRDLNLV
jgi:tRNA(Ile2) C34 agmatinyltransferase TiaS